MSSPVLSSWVSVPEDSDFPIHNLPYGVFTTKSQAAPHIGVAIGAHVLDMNILATHGYFKQTQHLHGGDVFLSPTLNLFMSLPRAAWIEARQVITHLLSASTPTLRDKTELHSHCLLPLSNVTLQLPVNIGDYTDFYSSKNHAYNVGVMFRGANNALQPNYLHLPVGYHGRASSVIITGTDVHRPHGQITPDDSTPPTLSLSQLLDYELEVGVFVGGEENPLGTPITMSEARERLFGLVLLNDWSARDVQRWEYVPLGPFTAKNFGTTISPWVVTFEALEAVKCVNIEQVPNPLPYLSQPSSAITAYDIELLVTLQSPSMSTPARLALSNTKYLYWSFAQQLVHHSITGCNMRAGDLLGSGTISGESPDSYGSMLELSWKGTKEIPVEGDTKGKRKFLLDGDEVCFRGKAKLPNGVTIGFGECKGRILPAVQLKS